jgi:hypothetical protein
MRLKNPFFISRRKKTLIGSERRSFHLYRSTGIVGSVGQESFGVTKEARLRCEIATYIYTLQKRIGNQGNLTIIMSHYGPTRIR